MATFYNQATLSFNGNTTTSNITQGELVEVLTAAKTPILTTYTPGDDVTYAVSIVNTGAVPYTGLTITDDLGGYTFGTGTVYPMEYIDGSATLFVNGAVQPAPTAAGGPPLVISGITVPAGGNAVVVYKARLNAYAPPAADGSITNTAVINGGGLTAPITVTATITPDVAAQLSVTKSLSPTVVSDNDQLTYTFVISNSGNTPAVSTDTIVLTDTFDPALDPITVTYNGVPWTEGVQYTYDPATGLFTTLTGQITVPAASYAQDPVTGEWIVSPGSATLVITGTV